MSAFLGPKLWENTLPDNNDLKFEYMDIEEFLSEHGIASGNDDNLSQAQHPPAPPGGVPQKDGNGPPAPTPTHSPSTHSPSHPQQSLTSLMTPSAPHQPMIPVRSEELCKKREDGSMHSSCSQNLREVKDLDSKLLMPPTPSQESMMPSPQVNSSPSSPSKGKYWFLQTFLFVCLFVCFLFVFVFFKLICVTWREWVYWT